MCTSPKMKESVVETVKYDAADPSEEAWGPKKYRTYVSEVHTYKHQNTIMICTMYTLNKWTKKYRIHIFKKLAVGYF